MEERLLISSRAAAASPSVADSCLCESRSHFPPISTKFSATEFWRKLKVNRKALGEGGQLHNVDVHVTLLTVTGWGGPS